MLYFITAPNRTDLYWRPDKCGYTNEIAKAGLYDEIESKRIEDGGRGDKRIPLNKAKGLELEELANEYEKDIERIDWMLTQVSKD
jgi:hypothetical protein